MYFAKHLNYWFIFSGGMLFFTLPFSYNQSEGTFFSVFIINIVYLFTNYYLIKVSLNRDPSFYLEKNIIIKIFSFSFFFVFLINFLYFYISNSFFEFSAVDSLMYDEWAREMIDYGFFEGILN